MKITLNFEIIKLLIIRLSSIGDIILATPVIKAIKQQFPNSEIHCLVNKNFAKVMEGNPYISYLHLYDKSLPQRDLAINKSEILRGYGKFDFIVDLQNNHRSRLFRKNLSDKIYSIDKRRLFKLCLVHFKTKILPSVHCTDNYYNCISDLITTRNYDAYANTDKSFHIQKYLTDTTRKLITIAPGANHFTKRYPAEKFIELINNLDNYNIVLIGGKEEIGICKHIEYNASQKIINLCGELSLDCSAAAVSQSDLLICNDTGLMHVAAACGTPIIAIFGSSVQELGFTPLSNNYTIIENNKIKCRPCSHIGRNKCPKKHFNCMNEIPAKTIIDEIHKLL